MTTSPSDVELKTFLATERTRVEAALQDALRTILPRIPDAFAPAVTHGVTSGGKRLRPILCVAGYRAAGGAHAGIYRLAVSLELIHAYSLMHDDLPCMDDADLRRGEPTTHKLHGERAALIAGALLIPAAALQAWDAGLAMGLADNTCRAVVRELAQASGAGGMVGGQVLDLLGEERLLSASELGDLHERKTGALLTASLRMGGLAAGAAPRVLAALQEYGKAVGLAFQIADDVLDATASAEALGKNPSDQALGKSTYVSLFGVDGAASRARERAGEAVAALEAGGLDAPELRALAHYIVARRR